MYTVPVHQFGQVMLIAVEKLPSAISKAGGSARCWRRIAGRV